MNKQFDIDEMLENLRFLIKNQKTGEVKIHWGQNNFHYEPQFDIIINKEYNNDNIEN